MTITSIYKLDSKGKIRVFSAWTEGNELVTETGLYNGKLVEQRKPCKGKNLGKKNETTPEEQAINEMNSKITKKRDEGYVDIDGVPTVEMLKERSQGFAKPMLAVTYKGLEWEKEEGIVASPKLDGMRCLATVNKDTVTLRSREGKLLSFPHIEEELLRLYKGRVLILDGELYVHDEPDGWKEEFGYDDFFDGSTRFQSLMKACKKYTEGVTEKVQYWLYDTVWNTPFMERFELYRHIESDVIKILPQMFVQNGEELDAFLEDCLSKGYEGAMLRRNVSSYEEKRSNNLMKVKEFKDEEFLVVDIVPAEARPTWGMPVCRDKAGNVFSATFKGTVEEKEELLINKSNYIGKQLTVKYFEKTSSGVPRFPVALRFREEL